MPRIALIGFGEAAQAFAKHSTWSGRARAFDILTQDPRHRAAKLRDYSNFGIEGAESITQAVASADLVLSLVTAGQALHSTRSLEGDVLRGAFYFDMNSVSPGTKVLAATAVRLGGGRYVDAAIMAPVHPGALDVPLLVSGPDSVESEGVLRAAGFTDVRVVGSRIGDASSIKMIRSIIVKGIEALTIEAMLAAAEVGVVEEVLDSLDASDHSMPWAQRANYNLERVMAHGVRRAEELVEAARMLTSLGVDAHLTCAAAKRQLETGLLELHPRLLSRSQTCSPPREWFSELRS